MNNKYVVYMHICPNEKKYIGITCRKPEIRWGKNGYGYRKNLLFYRAIQKYGWNNIQHSILFQGLCEEEAKQKEIELIAYYKTNNSNFGYNISLGGDKTTTGYKFTEKQRKKLSESKFTPVYCIEDDKIYYSKKELEENHILGFYKAVSGKRNTYLGKHYIHAKDIKKYKKGGILLKDDTRKKVICLETKKIYISISEASKETGCNPNSISECCNNKLKSTNHLHWQFYNENFDILKCEEIIKQKKKQNDKRIKKVRCIETNVIYESPTEAKQMTGIFHILECCKGLRNTAGGYRWEYV